MSNLYLVELNLEYMGIDYKEFLKLWLEDVNYYLSKQDAGEAKQLWKVAGERKVYIVIEQCSSDLDKMMFSTPFMKKHGDQVNVTVTELLGYEAFSNNINQMISSNVRYQPIEPAKQREGGIYIWAEFSIGYTGHTLDGLLNIWSQEAAVAMASRGPLVVGIWKCVGMRRVHVLLHLDTAEQFDVTSFRLPLMTQNGNNVDVKVKPVIRFESLADHLKTAIEH